MKTCPKCHCKLQQGHAIQNTCTGMPDFIGGEAVTMSIGGPGRLVECVKCPECGYSQYPSATRSQP